MRYIWLMLVTVLLSLPCTSQAADTVKHDIGGFSITLPSDWSVAPASVLKQYSQKVKTGKLIMMAGGQGDAPQLTSIEQKNTQVSLTQDEVLALDDKAVQAMCEKMVAGAKNVPGATDIKCFREKTAKGAALVTSMKVSAGGHSFASANWTFYKGKTTFIVSALYDITAETKVGSKVDAAFKSIELK